MIAGHTFKSLLVLSAIFYSNSAFFDGCPEITTARASEIFQTGLFGDGNPTFTLGDRVVNCLSVGLVQDQYRFATYTSEFTSSAFSNELRYLQIDIKCTFTTRIWEAETNAQLLNNQDEIHLLFNSTTLRTDCSACSRTTPGSDSVTHCVGMYYAVKIHTCIGCFYNAWWVSWQLGNWISQVIRTHWFITALIGVKPQYNVWDLWLFNTSTST